MKTFIILMGDKVLHAANITLFLTEGNATFQLEFGENKDEFFFPSKFTVSFEFYSFLGIHGPQVKSPYSSARSQALSFIPFFTLQSEELRR